MKDSCINCNSIIHVAVVDDNNTFIERYTMMVDGFMKKNGLECSITCFADGNELIQNIDGSSDSLASFDLYCLDIEMPGMNGLELAAMLKDEHFIQPYKGYLVNCQYIGFLKSRELTLKSGDVRTIPVSKYKWQEVKEEYMKYIKS